MNNKKSPPAIVVFAVLTTITVFIWVGLEVYRAFTKDPSPDVPPEVIRQLNSTLDTAALSDLAQRVHLDDSEIGNTQIIDLVNLQTETEEEVLEVPVEEELEETVEETPEATDEGEVP